MSTKNLLLGLLIGIVISGYAFAGAVGMSALMHSSKTHATRPAISSSHPYTFTVNRSSGDCISAYVNGSRYYEAVVPHAFKPG